MKIKIHEATGLVLDRLVMIAMGFTYQRGMPEEEWSAQQECKHALWRRSPSGVWACLRCSEDDHPSTDWSQGGPIMERERIDTFYDGNYVVARKAHMVKHPTHGMMRYCAMRGHTTLIASMRCYVASKLGDEVDIPNGIGE